MHEVDSKMSDKGSVRITGGETSSVPAVPSVENNKNKKKVSKNWRLKILAQPKEARPKYERPDDSFDSGVSPTALKAQCVERVEHMSRPVLRLLVMNKRQFTGLPATYRDYNVRMDKRIESAWNSMYNEYKKARRDMRLKTSASVGSRRSRRSSRGSKSSKGGKGGKGKEKGGGKKAASAGGKKGKGGKGDGKKGKNGGGGAKKVVDKDTASLKSQEEMEREFQEWVAAKSLPKKVFEPEPIQRGPIADLGAIKEHMDELSVPMKPREKYVESSVPAHLVPEATLTYEATDRILELARPAPFRMIKIATNILGSVRPGALQYVATPRVTELATPRARASANDADLKEDPFSISPNALKYKATARIIELAKPVER